jgi:RNA binding exosome subunit
VGEGVLRIRLLRVRVHAYASEDLDRVRMAVENAVGILDEPPVTRYLEGYFGDRITAMEYVMKDGEKALEILRRILKHIGMSNVGVEERSKNNGVIHLRIDKQAACMGEIRVGEADAIKLEFSYEGDLGELMG